MFLILFLMLFLGGVTICGAKEGAGPTFTNAEKAGIEYKIQGEYEGEVGGEKWGAQIVATGDGKFRGIGYPGGLPGNGWTEGFAGDPLIGKLDNDSVEMKTDEFTLKIDGKFVHVFDTSLSPLGKLAKVERKSETLGQKATEGAVVLFDGAKSIDNWESAKLIEEKLLGATSCYTKEKLGDHTLHIEFRTPFMPAASGQARGNSGVYVQSRYEVQVLDSFGLEGKDNECGGIYQVSKPRVNMCFPPLTWQTYDIDFTAAKWQDGKKTKTARITVRHNGVVIHDDLELPKHTPGRSQEADSPAPLFLQDHGNPVAFRNVWVVKK